MNKVEPVPCCLPSHYELVYSDVATYRPIGGIVRPPERPLGMPPIPRPVFQLLESATTLEGFNTMPRPLRLVAERMAGSPGPFCHWKTAGRRNQSFKRVFTLFTTNRHDPVVASYYQRQMFIFTPL